MADDEKAYADDVELESEDEEKENWLGIGIALLVIAGICSLIALSIVMLSPKVSEGKGNRVPFELDEVINGSCQPRTFNGTWMNDDLLVFRDPDGAIVMYNVTKRATTVMVSSTTLRQYNVQSFSMSSSHQYVLLRLDTQIVSTYSYLAQYQIYNISNERTTSITSTNPSTALYQYVTWGPYGNQMIYVYNNNIYYMAKMTSKPQQITKTGKEGVVFSGLPDGMYESSIFKSNHAIWWSHDGMMLCYAMFNDTGVNVVTDLMYGSHEDSSIINPTVRRLHYAKPDTPLPKVSLWVVDLHESSSLQSKEVIPPKKIRFHREYYLHSVAWVDNHRLLVTWSSRNQNFSVVSLCSADRKWDCDRHLEERSSQGWVDISDTPVITADRGFYFLKLPVQHAGEGTFRHVTMLDVNRRGFMVFLTHGPYDVTRIVAHRQETRSAYYLATLPGKSGERHLFGVKDFKSSASRNITCLTCNRTSECLYHDVIFSPNARYYVLMCLGPGIPRTELWSVDDHQLLTVLDTNDDMRDKLSRRLMPQVKTFQVPNEDGNNVQVQVYLPSELCEDEITQYPTVVYVDASPGSQLVSEKFKIDWGTYLASTKEFIYITIDGRGSGFKGDRHLYEIYRRLGTVEIQDQLSVIKSLRNDLPFINVEKLAIWGWGYGGYAAINALATDKNTLQCGIAVAPITNWRYHDAAYTERYMQSPKPDDNYLGYERANVNLKASQMKGKRFLLVHGTADATVHFQHSMMLNKALTEAGINFLMQFYPDEDHSLRGVLGHLHRTMERFLNRCFLDE